MLKDITIGQYFPGKSIIHKLDPRFKIIFTGIFIAMLFVADGFVGLGVGLFFVLGAFLLSRIPLKLMLKSLKPILPIIIFTSIMNVLFVKSGKVLVHFWIITITTNGISTAIFMMIRIAALIIGTSLLTYTTSPIVLTDAIERLLSPLKLFKIPVHDFAMIMTIALRFIPTLIEETDKIMSAQKARGADLESGNLIQRAKALIPIFIPLFVSSFSRATDLALAMECRCYHGGEGRTRMKQLKAMVRDYIAFFVIVGFLALVIVINKIPVLV
ncbi:MAG: energy-coupling factor transporter transmembrane protein EcfT [Clostridiales bacterium]|nr:energy-coupling factor transporter transmembrane protein EcfT [Clostridiales bacterium]